MRLAGGLREGGWLCGSSGKVERPSGSGCCLVGRQMVRVLEILGMLPG